MVAAPRVAITDTPYLLLATAGELAVEGIRGPTPSIVVPGEAVLFAPGAPVSLPLLRRCRYLRCTWDSTHTFIAEATADPEGGRRRKTISGCVLTGPPGVLAEGLLERLLRLPGGEAPAVAGGLVAGLVADLIISCSQRDQAMGTCTSVDARWRVLERYLREHVVYGCNRRQAAAAVGIHPRHVSRLIERYAHCHFTDFMRGLRIAIAKQHLREGELDIQGVAIASGFGSSAQFIRVFKRQVGQTPGSWRAAERSTP